MVSIDIGDVGDCDGIDDWDIDDRVTDEEAATVDEEEEPQDDKRWMGSTSR